MKIPGLLLAIVLTLPGLAQIKLTTLDGNALPRSIQYTGKIVHAVRWADQTGNNIVILTATEKTRSKNAPDEGYRNAALYAYHYLLSGDTVKQSWRVYESIKECPVDIFLHFVDKSFAVTDLNKNGKAEVWMMYKTSCQGDVSPVPMKIIMYEERKKFAARGTTRVQVSENEYRGGQVLFDEAFKKGSPTFKAYAEKLWNQHKVEKW